MLVLRSFQLLKQLEHEHRTPPNVVSQILLFISGKHANFQNNFRIIHKMNQGVYSRMLLLVIYKDRVMFLNFIFIFLSKKHSSYTLYND